MKASKFVLVLGLVVVAVGFYSQARAETKNAVCTATLVEYDDSPRLRVDCGGTEYWAFGTAWQGCTKTTSVDTLKVWQSLATSGLLSGKKLVVHYKIQSGSGCGSVGAKTIAVLGIKN